MSLSSTSIKRPVLATVMNILFIIVGMIGLTFLGVRDYPSVDPPIITVSTTFTGANADVIETQITEPLESAINGIPGIRSLVSQSRDGRSNITIEFELEVPLETAANDVRDKVSGALRKLPQDIDPPVVTKADADAQPIFGLYLSSDKQSIIDVSTYADLHVKERLQTISVLVERAILFRFLKRRWERPRNSIGNYSSGEIGIHKPSFKRRNSRCITNHISRFMITVRILQS